MPDYVDPGSTIDLPIELDVNGNCRVNWADLSYFNHFVHSNEEKDGVMSFKWCPYFEPDLP